MNEEKKRISPFQFSIPINVHIKNLVELSRLGVVLKEVVSLRLGVVLEEAIIGLEKINKRPS